VSKVRTVAAIVLLTLTATTVSAAVRVAPGDDSPSFAERARRVVGVVQNVVPRIVTSIVQVLDDSKLSPPVP